MLIGNMTNKKLKVFKGNAIVSEHVLLDAPVSICHIYTDNKTVSAHLRPYTSSPEPGSRPHADSLGLPWWVTADSSSGSSGGAIRLRLQEPETLFQGPRPASPPVPLSGN